MHTLHITVAGKVATYSARDGSIICGNDDYQVQFALDSEWDGLAAKARFRWNGKHQDVPIVDGLAAVPRISNANEVKVGVYSEDGSLQTTTAARVPCDKSILCGDSAPTEGNEAHYASEAQEAADRAEAAADRAEAAGGNGGTGGGVVIDPESVNQAQEAAQAARESSEAAADSAQAAGQSAEEAETSKNQATAAKEAAEAAESRAAQKATDAEDAAQTAASKATEATQAQEAAEAARGKAEGARDTAVANAEAASTSATVAAREAGNASKSAAAAATDRTAAETAAGTATSAKTAAEAARDTASQKATEANEANTAAQTAKGEAQTAATTAAASAGTASTAAAGATAAKTAAETAKNDAEASAQRAEVAADTAVRANTPKYEPVDDDLPRVFFTGKFPDTKQDGAFPVTMTYISKTQRFASYATAGVQGSSSTTFTKRNYTVKLFEDAAHASKKKIAFRNWPAKNKFVFKANFIDRTHARNVVSARIWGDLVKSRAGYNSLPVELRESPNMGAIDGFPVQVYLNGIYQGLYTLNIPKDDWMAGCDEDLTDQHAIICGEGIGDGKPFVSFNSAYSSTAQAISGLDWEDELQTVGDTTRANFKAFSDLVVSGTDAAFKANLATYLDVESMIDTYIFMWLACGVDSLGKNQFMYTYTAGRPWYSGVYDLDSTWGLKPEGNALADYNTAFPDGYYYPAVNGVRNKLYDRMWKNFKTEIRARWNEVKTDALSLANIINHFEAFHDSVPVDLFAEDSAATTAGGQFVTSADASHKGFNAILGTDKNNLQQIRNFAAARWVYVDNLINLIECTGVSLSASTLSITKDQEQGKLTATVTPTNCNQAVVWSTDDEAVATVSNGTVTAIGNGTCNITVTCGTFSATCVVTISGFESGEVGSENLADPSSPDWKKGYYIADNNCTINPANKAHRTVTNYIKYTVGDVFTIEGCQAAYGNSGPAQYAIYDLDKNPKDITTVALLQEKGYFKTANGVTTITLGADVGTNRGTTLGHYGNEGYIRFQLGMLDGQSDIATNDIVIKRNA